MTTFRATLAAVFAVLLATSSMRAAAAPPAADTAPLRIPFVVGLTTVRAVSEPRGDYESLGVLEAIQPDRYRWVVSGEVQADDGSGLTEISVPRVVRNTDQATARRIRNYFHTGDSLTFSGTVPGFSAQMVTELRERGSTRVTFLDIGALFGMTIVKAELSGNLARVAGAPNTMPMLVNGHRIQLPVIRARGKLSDGGDAEDFQFDVLDDPVNPLVLRTQYPGTSTSVVKIEYPQPKDAAHSIEHQLADDHVAEIYGIYFSFARADIRPQSERVLKEIADALKKHPGWKLRIDGHTDNIGDDTVNLALSQRRAVAVKDALVKRYAIAADRLTTGGYGESRPKADNHTAEGRALNRRVELTRL